MLPRKRPLADTGVIKEEYNSLTARMNADEQVSLIEQKKNDILDGLRKGEALDVVTMDLANILLQALVDMLPSFERNAKASSKNIYHLERVSAIIRELSHDLRSSQDRNAMRTQIMTNTIDPAILQFASRQITELNQLQRFVRGDAQAIEFINTLKNRVAVLTNELHVNVANQLDAYFGGSKDAQKILEEKDETTESYGSLLDDDLPIKPDEEYERPKQRIPSFKTRKG
jgi:hypothetical protein